MATHLSIVVISIANPMKERQESVFYLAPLFPSVLPVFCPGWGETEVINFLFVILLKSQAQVDLDGDT